MNLKKLLKTTREEYKSYRSLYCPALEEHVHFTAEGFNHLRFRPGGIGRKPEETIRKLFLFPFVRRIISESMKVKIRDSGRIQYFALEGNLSSDTRRARVILRKIGNGKLHFWSVMAVR